MKKYPFIYFKDTSGKIYTFWKKQCSLYKNGDYKPPVKSGNLIAIGEGEASGIVEMKALQKAAQAEVEA